jgi:uncharacterized RDD family membrane protein YckC
MSQTPIWKHFAAFIYDVFPILGIFLLTSLFVALVRKGDIVEPHTFWFSFLIFFELAGYYIYSWKVGGQTLGMRAWKMKIIPNQVNQATLTWTQAFLRFMVGMVSFLLLGSGLFWKFFTKNNHSWMDNISHSQVKNLD